MASPVERYTSLIYPSLSSRVALCFIPPDDRQPEHRFTSAGRIERYLGYAGFRNANGWGIHITPSVMKDHARNRRKESFAPSQQIIYLDCDRPECLEAIKDRYPYPTLVAKTSKGRYQVYWRLEQPVPIAEQEGLMSAMAMDIGADRAATDVSRVLRLPGFWNRKQGREPNTVDIVFTRDVAVSYQSLSHCMDRIEPMDSAPRPARVLGESRRRHGELGHSESERDWYEVHRRLAAGDDPKEVVDWLENHRRDKRNPRYYAERTVKNAIEVRQEQQRGRA